MTVVIKHPFGFACNTGLTAVSFFKLKEAVTLTV